MRQAIHSLHIQTRRKGLVEITGDVAGGLSAQKIATGLLTIFCRHTSASLLIQENADPDVRADLENFFEAIAIKRKASTICRPTSEPLYRKHSFRFRWRLAGWCWGLGRASICLSTAGRPTVARSSCICLGSS